MSARTMDAAYAVCRAIARREAKNFYYAFRVLPRPKMDAMCAVYAFMRRADDIADDESLTIDERILAMQAWLDRWRASRLPETQTDPIFQALGDTQQRFNIPDVLLEQLVEGTTMDLHVDLPGTTRISVGDRELQAYESFEDLYRYCYLVASVVGLVCIRIFGYSNSEAELLAEKTGIAFQLTNILRDVKEDAERGRIYLPLAILHEFGVTPEDVLAVSQGRAMRASERAMLGALSVQAWEYYESGRALIPMLDPESRPAMWVLLEIYSGLLAKIDQRQGDVFSARVSVPTRHKLFALIRGAAMSMRARGR